MVSACILLCQQQGRINECTDEPGGEAMNVMKLKKSPTKLHTVTVRHSSWKPVGEVRI